MSPYPNRALRLDGALLANPPVIAGYAKGPAIPLRKPTNIKRVTVRNGAPGRDSEPLISALGRILTHIVIYRDCVQLFRFGLHRPLLEAGMSCVLFGGTG